MKYILSKHELFLCEYMGTLRRKNAMQFNMDRQYSQRDAYEIDIDGFMGEYIVAKHLNLMCDFSLSEKKSPIDLITSGGSSIDVKSTRSDNKGLSVTGYHKKSPCDFYILVLCEDDGGEILGWADKHLLFQNAKEVIKTINGKQIPYYEFNLDKLENIKHFK